MFLFGARAAQDDESALHALGDFTANARLLLLSSVAILIGIISAYVAVGLLSLITFFTNLFFFQRLSFAAASPTAHMLGGLVVIVPVVGGVIIGLMARYGSDRIRGHGIPEAIESILINGSRVEPKLAILKPLSAAIAIGSGGPFGAEGPIIMTGGAFGSFVAQFLHLTSAERKTLLGILLVKSSIWAIALGSGTSGGVLAPLLMMGGALGGVEGAFLPDLAPGFWPLVSMGAILGGAMRSPLTGIVFAIELTHDLNMMLPLLIAVTVAHAFTVLTLRRSILTEKVSRRGYHLTREYSIDPLEILFVREVVRTSIVALSASMTLEEARAVVAGTLRPRRRQRLYPVVDHDQRLLGVVTRSHLEHSIRPLHARCALRLSRIRCLSSPIRTNRCGRSSTAWRRPDLLVFPWSSAAGHVDSWE